MNLSLGLSGINCGLRLGLLVTHFFISVVLDESGGSKGFGFIRFGNETEQQTALTTMQGIAGLGGKPIKVILYFYNLETRP